MIPIGGADLHALADRQSAPDGFDTSGVPRPLDYSYASAREPGALILR